MAEIITGWMWGYWSSNKTQNRIARLGGSADHRVVPNAPKNLSD